MLTGVAGARNRVPKIVVTGDQAIEWRFARSTVLQTPTASLDYVNAVRCYHEPGGPVMLGRLIKAAAKGDAEVLFRDITVVPADEDGVGSQRGNASYFPSSSPYWHLYDRCAQVQRDTNDQHAVWRITDVLGTDRPLTRSNDNLAPVAGHETADMIVVEDVGGAFAGDEDRWPECLRSASSDSWLVLRWIPPSDVNLKEPSKLLGRFRNGFVNRKTLVVTAEELRLIGMRVSKALSWERTAEDLVREVSDRWNEEFRGCAHLVVSFLTDGAMVFTLDERGLGARLYYDPRFAEGEWEIEKPGRMVGSARCLTAAIVLSLLSRLDTGMLPDEAVIAGVTAARLLHKDGFLAEGAGRAEASGTDPVEGSYPDDLRFPTKAIANLLRLRIDGARTDQLAHDLAGIRVAEVPVHRGVQPWRLIDSALPDPETVLEAASQIVVSGDDVYEWPFPLARFGDFVAIDRFEIESMRAVRELMKNYLNSTVRQSPISIAVFGSPGNGKTFAITEIARQLSESEMASCVYNLSQFESHESIHNALHQVQNITLSGALPLVFWDEFDAFYADTSLGWLRFFLGPMREGKFHQGQVTHNIGKAIFIFSGGTYRCKAEFEEHGNGELTKASDFLSRLHGYLDIADLNHPTAGFDAAVMLRRAVRLRKLLIRSAGTLTRHYVDSEKDRQEVRTILSIDPGILRAFLLVPEYKHGARSMEAIITMSALSGKYRYTRSSLPPSDQLQLHVDADRFLDLLGSA
jgi:hypothetical protein